MNRLILEQLNYNRDEELADLQNRLGHLNEGLHAAYDGVVASLATEEGRLFFLNGPGLVTGLCLDSQAAVDYILADPELSELPIVCHFMYSISLNGSPLTLDIRSHTVNL